MSNSNSFPSPEDVYFDISYLVSQLNDELKSCQAMGLILFPKIKKGKHGKEIQIDYINYYQEDKLTYRELCRGKLYNMILIRLWSRFLNFYKSNDEHLLLFLFYKIGKYLCLCLKPIAEYFSSIHFADEFYVSNDLS